MMITIPVLAVISIMLSILLGFLVLTGAGGRTGLLLDTNGTVSNYQLQLSFDSITKAIADKNSLKGSGDLLDSCAELEREGAQISICSDSDSLYLTKGTGANELLAAARNITGGKVDGALFYRSGSGLVYQAEAQNKEGRPVQVLIVSKRLAYQNPQGNFLGTVERYIKLGVVLAGGFAIIIIIITGVLLAGVLSKQIVLPINLLRKAANEIQNGNLDSTIAFSSGDELGQVCQDFDSMRLRLKESVQLQQKYEEGRKELIAGISHDLSTPLTSIKGYVSGLMDGIANTPEKQEHYLRTIYSTACDMDKLVDSLFLFSKLDLDKVPFTMEPVDLANYFEDYCEQMQPHLNRLGMKLVFSNQCDEPANVKIDRLQFQRILSNLVDNSIKYKKDAPGRIEITLRSAGTNIEIQFSDDGRGIAAEDAEKIFDSFYRSDPARSNAAKGSGLGLAIVKQITERMGGSIGAQGQLNRGLTIRITLPRADKGGAE